MIVQVQNGQLPQGFCPADYQSLLNTFSQTQYVNLGSLAGVLASPTVPPPAQRGQAWLQLDTSGRPVRMYYFAQGAWLSLHPLPPGFAMIWNQPLPNFQTFDGGDNTPAPFSSVSGQMWQLMSSTLDGVLVAGQPTTVAKAEFLVGVGTFAKRGGVAVNTDVTDTGKHGEDEHVLTQNEMPRHSHPESDTDGSMTFVVAGGTNTGGSAPGSGSNWGKSAFTGLFGGDVAHNNLPPFYGVYFLQRTNRQYYVVPG